MNIDSLSLQSQIKFFLGYGKRYENINYKKRCGKILMAHDVFRQILMAQVLETYTFRRKNSYKCGYE